MFAEITAIEAGLVSALIAMLAGAVGMLYKKSVADADSRLAEVTSRMNSYKEINEEALAAVEKLAAVKRENEGKPPMPKMLPVVPEHNSPQTEAQTETAELQTARARLTAALHELGFAPRKHGTPAV